MSSKLLAALMLFSLMSFRAEAQDTDLQRIADALDVSTTKTFQFTGNGTMYSLGQSTSPAAPWPRQFVKSMTRVYDFTTGSMRDTVVRGGTYSKFKIDPSKKYFINVGAVGQPRDNNPKCAYVVYDMDAGTIELRRLEYDIEGAQRKILEAGLPERLAERLAYGR